MIIKPGKYIHYKGNEYKVIGVAKHSETSEEVVIYRSLQEINNELWVRPASKWNEIVDYNGKQLKRFTYISNVHTEQSNVYNKTNITHDLLTTIHKRSPSDVKIELFISLFAGREDVFAKRWENDEKNGYSPACKNEWKPGCSKKSKKAKCKKCPNRNLIKLDKNIIASHLKGNMTIGVYPMLINETCRFIVIDFDGKDCAPDILQQDIKAIQNACNEKQICVAIERSRSGKGYHMWFFFSEQIPVNIARRFGSSVITYTMSKYHDLTFKTYDRIIPAQDTMPEGGFGNLIALPLQGFPRKSGNSIFINEYFNAYDDQWSFLSSIHKYSLHEVEQLIRVLSPFGDLGLLRTDDETEKPWKSKNNQIKLTHKDFPEVVPIVRANMLFIKKDGISSTAINALKRLAAFRNPEFYMLQAMRKSIYNKKTKSYCPRIISCADDTELFLGLPRGLEDELIQLINNLSVKIDWSDETNTGNIINVIFNGTLFDEQKLAVNALLAHKNGILHATTAFGKTVIGSYLISKLKVNTLILVGNVQLLTQWIERLNEFLTINEEPMIELTPSGRKRKKSVIGQFGGGIKNRSEVIDIATIQSLVSNGNVNELVRNYGMIIIDECHHVSAFTYEAVLKYANSKYVYGLTATPVRKDGLHPINYMHCGKIRYHVDDKSQADKRPFEHYIIPRFTGFKRPLFRDEQWNYTNILNDIQKNEIRNDLIIQDVIEAIELGRNPIIITERTEHVEILTNKLNPFIDYVIPMTGGGGQKKNRELRQEINSIPQKAKFVIVATGKYIGEGFDLPRLDTLFLTMPISWKGTISQYAGRLHRIFDGKTEVQIYDYVDIHEPKLEGMYQKRLKGYAAIGYIAKATPQQNSNVNSIFNNKNYIPVFSSDISSALNDVVIVSPLLTKERVQYVLNNLNITTAYKTIITRPVSSYQEKSRTKAGESVELLKKHGINVLLKDNIHQRLAIIDQKIIWYGSINLLGNSYSTENTMRLENINIAAELLGMVQ